MCGRPGGGGVRLGDCAPQLARLPGEADHGLALAPDLVTEVGAAETSDISKLCSDMGALDIPVIRSIYYYHWRVCGIDIRLAELD